MDQESDVKMTKQQELLKQTRKKRLGKEKSKADRSEEKRMKVYLKSIE